MDELIDSAPATEKEPSAIHERGKRKRRRAILDAACDIILQSGEQGMTMRARAHARSGVRVVHMVPLRPWLTALSYRSSNALSTNS